MGHQSHCRLFPRHDDGIHLGCGMVRPGGRQLGKRNPLRLQHFVDLCHANLTWAAVYPEKMVHLDYGPNCRGCKIKTPYIKEKTPPTCLWLFFNSTNMTGKWQGYLFFLSQKSSSISRQKIFEKNRQPNHDPSCLIKRAWKNHWRSRRPSSPNTGPPHRERWKMRKLNGIISTGNPML